MRTKLTLAALAVVALSLAACDNDVAAPPEPRVEATRSDTSGVPAPPVPDTSVPAASTVVAPVPKAPDDGEKTNTMTRAEELREMPLAGQANAHSAPTPADEREIEKSDSENKR